VGVNQVTLAVSNAEARTLEPAQWSITYKKTPPARPEVEILEPRDGSIVTSRSLTVQLRVVSKSPLKRLEFLRLEPTSYRQPIDVSRLAANAQDAFELRLALALRGPNPAKGGAAIDLARLKPNAQGVYEAATDMQMADGLNRFRLEAVNEGGQGDVQVIVNRFSLPVQLVIDRIEPRGWAAAPVSAQVDAGGRLTFAAIAQGRAWLCGRVVWDQDRDDQLKQINAVQIFVNGLRQAPVELDPPAAGVRERAFKAAIAFNQAKDNRVLVELPGLKQDANNRRDFSVACLKPEAKRVHLLIVGIGEQNDRELVDRVLQALHAEEVDLNRKRFKTSTFSEGRLYPPLTGYVRPGQVLAELRRIKDEIDLLARGGSTNDVMMVYYQGGVARQGGDDYFLTSVSQHIPELRRSGITRDHLVNCLGETLGAQLVFLEVNRQGAGESAAAWAANSKVAMLGYEWPDRAANPMPVRFTKVLGEAIPQAPTLSAVAEKLGTLTKQVGQPALVYIQDVPGRMGNLEIGTTRP
jgi:hypothetical protein